MLLAAAGATGADTALDELLKAVKALREQILQIPAPRLRMLHARTRTHTRTRTDTRTHTMIEDQ